MAFPRSTQATRQTVSGSNALQCSGTSDEPGRQLVPMCWSWPLHHHHRCNNASLDSGDALRGMMGPLSHSCTSLSVHKPDKSSPLACKPLGPGHLPPRRNLSNHWSNSGNPHKQVLETQRKYSAPAASPSGVVRLNGCEVPPKR
eukprot:CAMPEP_0179191124 /NCGR_PEP_ID=MMETSP0796-20121207/94924_1 /TAXON_ID=73915 /ORGANISM="Pyrodinium bahamense, Strain pbaha01" /LENGTH=143 /DNA_ID=CAMNT_0020895337 /DNA_START=242 /DNA_END=673 /DNA_ORIENTATION=-